MRRSLPFRTFDEIAALGLEVEVYCPNCYRYTGPIDLSDKRLLDRPFTGVRFICGQQRRVYDALPPKACGCLGHIIIRPPARDFIPPGRSNPVVLNRVSALCAVLER